MNEYKSLWLLQLQEALKVVTISIILIQFFPFLQMFVHFFWHPLHIYVYIERDHISMLKAPTTYIVEQIVKLLLMQCFLNVFDLSILSISHPTELVTPWSTLVSTGLERWGNKKEIVTRHPEPPFFYSKWKLRGRPHSCVGLSPLPQSSKYTSIPLTPTCWKIEHFHPLIPTPFIPHIHKSSWEITLPC